MIKKFNNFDIEESIKDILIKRIPFLKEYNIFVKRDDRLEAQRISYNENVKIMMGDEILNFKQLNVSSEIIYYEHVIDENVFHNFIIKNKIYPTQPENMDDLKFKIFLLVMKKTFKKLSYNKEIMIKKGERISDKDIDEIINDMNKCLFIVEDYSTNHNISLF